MDEDSTWIPGRGGLATIPANHIDICKSDNRNEEGYAIVVAAIKKFSGMKSKTENYEL